MKLEKSYAQAHLRLHNTSISDYEKQHGTPEAIFTECDSVSSPSERPNTPAVSTASLENNTSTASNPVSYQYREACSSKSICDLTVDASSLHISLPEPGFPLSEAQQKIQPPGFNSNST